ncbi:MAG: type II toxin-antitoxin system RelE/ParE family toxin [Desulfosarcina sp.]|nr:type II toxin-antitoxin system RelE/ParE family toxin [Desulfosarcina sp.]
MHVGNNTNSICERCQILQHLFSLNVRTARPFPGQRPEIYGKPLRRNLKPYWKLRIGNYRVIFKIQEDQILILGINDPRRKQRGIGIGS